MVESKVIELSLVKEEAEEVSTVILKVSALKKKSPSHSSVVISFLVHAELQE